MTQWESEVAAGLTPQEVSAGLVMYSVLTSDLPDIAAWWLARGLDSPALRELAGAPPTDACGLDALWRRVADELGVASLTEHEAARTDVRRILSAWQAGRRSTLDVLVEFDRMALYRFDGLDVAGGLERNAPSTWCREPARTTPWPVCGPVRKLISTNTPCPASVVLRSPTRRRDQLMVDVASL